ncbi:MAG: DUF58 domain-containing protein [Chloroflexota bacterium]
MIRGAVVFVTACMAFLFALATGWQPLFQLALGLFALLVLCALWVANGLWGVELRRPRQGFKTQVGEALHDGFVLANRSRLPKLGLEIRDHSTLPGHHPGGVVNLGGRQRQEGGSDCVSEIRGLYTLGPTGAAVADPFGLFAFERRIGPASSVLVYPQTVVLPGFSIPGTIVAEGTRLRRRSQVPTLDPAGTRPYVYGDSVRRIHWLSSAHTGQLMVKEFEFTPAADLWIFLDLQAAPQVGAGVHSTEEYGVTTAASLAAHYLGMGRSVGLVASGQPRLVIPADRGEQQVLRILEALALVRANGRRPMAEVLWSEKIRLNRNATAVVVSPSTDERWAGVLAQIGHSGTRTAAMLVEAATFGPAPVATMLVASLTSAGIASYLIKHGESMASALRIALLTNRRSR